MNFYEWDPPRHGHRSPMELAEDELLSSLHGDFCAMPETESDDEAPAECDRDAVAGAILDYVARTGADLVAIATHGKGGLSRLTFGTVSDKIARKSPTSVLLFHPAHVSAIVTEGERSIGETLAGV